MLSDGGLVASPWSIARLHVRNAKESVMNRKSWIVAVASIAVFLGCGAGGSTGGLNTEATYVFDLTTNQVVPAPKPSSATGVAGFIVFSDRIDYQISAQQITAITSVHLHNGAPGAIGASVLTLFTTTSPVSPSGV